jgi:glutamate-1-semialdehyde 2,1-aminomutase
VGESALMRLGGIDHAGERVFLLSTTHGAETHALAAAIETMRTYEREGVVEVLYRQGDRLRRGIEEAARDAGVSDFFQLLGRPCNLVYVARDQEKSPSQEFRTLFLQEILKRGILAPSFVVSFAHDDESIDRTVAGVRGALRMYRQALDGGVGRFLEGRPVRPVFRPRN